MNQAQILSEIDSEISRLQQARSLIAGDGLAPSRAGRPQKKRTMSAAARAKIAAAQRKRWAKQKQAAKRAA